MGHLKAKTISNFFLARKYGNNHLVQHSNKPKIVKHNINKLKHCKRNIAIVLIKFSVATLLINECVYERRKQLDIYTRNCLFS